MNPTPADAHAALYVARTVLASVERAYGDPHAEIADARGMLDTAACGLRQPGPTSDLELDDLCRRGKRLVRRLENTNPRAERPARAHLEAITAMREALVVVLHARRGAPAGAADRPHRCRTSAAEALWNLGEGGRGSGTAARDAIATLWKRGLVEPAEAHDR